MSDANYSDVFYLRIAGVGDTSAAEQYIYTDREPPATWTPDSNTTAAQVCLRPPAGQLGAVLDALAPRGSSPAQTFELHYERPGTEAATRALHRSAPRPVQTSDHASLALAESVTAGATSITVTDGAALSAGSVIYIGGEAIEPRARVGVTGEWSVNRARMGTYAAAHQYGIVPTRIYDEVVQVEGLWATAGVIEADGTERQRFIGQVRRAHLRGGLIFVVEVDSVMTLLGKRKWQPPSILPTSQANDVLPTSWVYNGRLDENGGTIEEWSQPLWVDTGLYGKSDASSRWQYVTLVDSEGRWVTVEVEFDTHITLRGRPTDRYNISRGNIDTIVAAYGEGETCFTYGVGVPALRVRNEHIDAVLRAPVRIDYAVTFSDFADGFAELLTAKFPIGGGAGLPVEFVEQGDVDAVFEGLETSEARIYANNDGAEGNGSVMPPSRDKPLLDVLTQVFGLASLWFALAVRSDGTLTLVDWLVDRADVKTPIDLGELTIDMDHAEKRNATAPMPVLRLTDGRVHVADTATIVDVVSGSATVLAVRAGTKRVVRAYDAISAEWVSDATLIEPKVQHVQGPLSVLDATMNDRGAGLLARANTAVARYGRGLTEYTFALQSAVNSLGLARWEVGELLTVTHPRLAAADGSIDETDPPAVRVLVTGRTVDARARTESMTALLLEHVGAAVEAPTFAPVARIKTVALPLVTIATNEFTDPSAPEGPITDAQAWDVIPTGEGWRCLLCDGNTLAVLGTANVTEVSTGANTLKLEAQTVTPEATMILRLAPYDDQEGWVHALEYDEDHGGPPAFGAGANGELGTDGDDGQRYR